MEQALAIQTPFPQSFIDELGFKDVTKEDIAAVLEELQLNVSIDEISREARAIVVTDESQTGLMQQARDLRLKLRDERVRIEKIKDEIKRPYLRRTQLIDGINRTIRRMFEAEESYLKQQEDFAKIREQARIAELVETRRSQLLALGYTEEVPGLGTIAEANFALILEGAKARQELEREEAERRQREELERLEREVELRKENERLRLEKEEADRKTREAEAEMRRQNEERERQERERKAAEEAEARRIADEKAKAAAAPDREKILGFAKSLAAVEPPVVASEEAQRALAAIIYRRDLFLSDIQTFADSIRVETAPF